MKPIAMQAQLIYGALYREIHQKKKKEREMRFKFICDKVRFSMGEFAVIIGLRCKRDNNVNKFAKKENAFMEKYFSDQTITHIAVEERFFHNDFKTDDFAVKMVVLYFAIKCLLSRLPSKKVSDGLINMVGLGEFECFPWDKLVYDLTICNLRTALREKYKKRKSIDPGGKGKGKDKEKEKGKGTRAYKLRGFALAFQAWLYEMLVVLKKVVYCRYDSESV
ncbi:uncharacterized protein LOC133821211 isoform X1 [Humulus lupulus]|uniref:uncharacterized protein LOC133821211 isoform X1 n=1 Tax=Humulus lupulus TaxID=3486 RepID=UPI002B4113FB|nr:uncharacterized protein LOC133821211 isoform X1 [Humulus lupulus]